MSGLLLASLALSNSAGAANDFFTKKKHALSQESCEALEEQILLETRGFQIELQQSLTRNSGPICQFKVDSSDHLNPLDRLSLEISTDHSEQSHEIVLTGEMKALKGNFSLVIEETETSTTEDLSQNIQTILKKTLSLASRVNNTGQVQNMLDEKGISTQAKTEIENSPFKMSTPDGSLSYTIGESDETGAFSYSFIIDLNCTSGLVTEMTADSPIHAATTILSVFDPECQEANLIAQPKKMGSSQNHARLNR